MKFPKAHIIPAALYEDIKQNKPLKIIKAGAHVKHTYSGIYGTDIWCDECEDRYGRFDNYGVKILRSGIEEVEPVYEGGKPVGYEIKVSAPLQLQKFFISMLWRAHASSNSMFEQVHLGPYATEARKILMSKEDFYRGNFEAVVTLPENGLRLITNPTRVKIEGVNFYKFYLGKFELIIKCDRQALPSQLKFAQFSNDGILRVPFTIFDCPATNFIENPPLNLKLKL